MKKVISLVLVVITVLSVFTITSSAISWPSFSRSVPIKVYTISTGNNTTAYSSSSLSSKKGTIYASDEIYIEKIGRNSNGTYYAYGSYPISSGRKYAYIPLSVITKASAPSEKITAKTSATTYRRASTSNTYGSIDKGDYVYKLATSGNYTQVLYNVGSKSNPSAWKMGWVKTSVYNEMRGSSTGTSAVTVAALASARSAFNTVFGKNSFDSSSYNAKKAAEYAVEHAYDTPVYSGNDCARYVSECLAVGGVTIPNKNLYQKGDYTYTGRKFTGPRTPYANAPALLTYLSTKYKVIENPSVSQMKVGDVAFLVSSDGYYDGHAVMITKISNGVAYYSGHTKAQANQRIYPGDYWTTVRYLVKMS